MGAFFNVRLRASSVTLPVVMEVKDMAALQLCPNVFCLKNKTSFWCAQLLSALGKGPGNTAV